MLINFTIANWRSFRDEAIFSLEASRERVQLDTLARLPARYGSTRILPLGVIFGPNAGGKTSLISALQTLKDMVVRDTGMGWRLPAHPWKLDDAHRGQPTRMSVTFLRTNTIYTYSVAFTEREITEERLVERRTRGESPLFERTEKEVVFPDKYASERNSFIAQGTRPNQLFLHNAASQQAEEFAEPYRWFADELQIIGSDSYGQGIISVLRPDYQEFINAKLRAYGTGVDAIVLQDAPMGVINVPPDVLNRFLDAMPEGRRALQASTRHLSGGTQVHVITRENGALRAQKVMLKHTCENGEGILFDYADESSGTQHLMEILPLLFDLASAPSPDHTGRVYVVDELDRNIHSAITADIVRSFLENCTRDSRHQLVFTTHDLLLMDDRNLRRDEMWVCDRDADGTADAADPPSSRLTCIGAHPKTRTDSDILKSYRAGVYGGYPRL